MSILNGLLDNILSNTLTGVLGDSSTITNFNIVLTGDSLLARIAENATTVSSFESSMASLGLSANRVVDAATSGGNLTETDVVNNDEYILLNFNKGDLYVSNLDPVTDKADINCIIIAEPTNDRVALPTTITKATLKECYKQFIGLLRADFTNPNLKIFLLPASRHSSETNVLQWLLLRQIINEVAAEDANVHLLSEYYHKALVDAIHPSDASNEDIMDLAAKRINYIFNGVGASVECPEMASVQVLDDGFEITVTHKDGTDLTVPASCSPEFLVIETDNGYSDATNYTITKAASNKIKATGYPIAGGNQLVHVGGSMIGLATTGATPLVPLDNSANTLPLKSGGVTYTDIDALRAKSRSVLKESHTVSYVSGTTVDTIQSVNDKDWTTSSGALPFTYESGAFFGLGGYKGTDDINSKMVTDHAWSAKNLFFGVVDIPASLGTGDHLHLFQGGTGTAASPTLSAAIRFMVLASDGSLRYFNNNAGAGQNFGGNYRNSSFVWCVDMHSVSDWDIYIHDGTTFTTIVTGFDPRDDYATATIVAFGGGAFFGRHYFMNGDSIDNNINIETAMASLASTHNIGYVPDAWFDASDTSTISETSSFVSQWDDKSGNGRNLTQATGAAQPTTGANTLNGLNVITFDGGDLMTMAPTISQTNGYTIFAIIDNDSSSLAAYVAGAAGSHTSRFDENSYVDVVRTGQATILSGTVAATGFNNIVTYTSSAGNGVYINGTLADSNASNPSYTQPLTTIGDNGTATQPFTGKIGEIVIYERILTTAQINQVGNYLADKWGLTWSDIV